MSLKKWFRLFFPIFAWTFLLTTAVVQTACHAPVSVVTPQGKAAYTADQITTRVGELQKAAIQANATVDPKTGKPGLSEADTRYVVQACVTIAKGLQNVPDGWQAALKASWTSFMQQAPPTLASSPVGLLISSLDTIVKGL